PQFGLRGKPVKSERRLRAEGWAKALLQSGRVKRDAISLRPTGVDLAHAAAHFDERARRVKKDQFGSFVHLLRRCVESARVRASMGFTNSLWACNQVT